MGVGKIKIASELLLKNMLLLEGYELVDAKVRPLDGKADALELTVMSEQLPDDKVTDVLPIYRAVDYVLKEVKMG